MNRLLADLLDRERNQGDLIVVDEHLDPVGAWCGKGRIEPERDVTVMLGLVEQRQFRFRLGNDRLPVRCKEPDPRLELATPARPLVHDREPRMDNRKGAGRDSLEQPHEAEFSAYFLPHVIAEDGMHQDRLHVIHYHRRNISTDHPAGQPVFP